MTEIKLTKRYPNSRVEDITDAYMRGWNDALDAVQNGKFHIAEQTDPSDCIEVIRCKDCDNYAGDGMYCAWDVLTGDMGYCHHARPKGSTDVAEPTAEDCSMVAQTEPNDSEYPNNSND